MEKKFENVVMYVLSQAATSRLSGILVEAQCFDDREVEANASVSGVEAQCFCDAELKHNASVMRS